MKILFLGAPGCGKGTQSKILIGKFGIPQISTGDLLREEMKSGSDLGLEIKTIMSKGDFVDDKLVLSLVSKKIDSNECENGFILDGYPRNLEQAKNLDNLLSAKKIQLDFVFLIDVPDEVLIERCTGRLLCNGCDYIGNKDRGENPNDNCPKCSKGALYQRDDDKPETVRNRLQVYKQQTSPVINFYSDKGVLQKLVGGNDPSKLSEKISQILDI